jgi:four helix bundle protein
MGEESAGMEERMRARTKDFGLRVIRLFRALPRNEEARVIGRQLLRSGTSVGGNYRAVTRARSRREFIAKMGVVLEEADESAYWLEVLVDARIMPGTKLKPLYDESEELVKIFAAALRTARRKPSGT